MDEATAVTESAVIAELAVKAAVLSAKPQEPISPGAAPFIVLPMGYAVADVENLLAEPTRRRATVSVATVDSFIAYVNRFKTASAQLFAKPNGNEITAYLDYHEGGAEGGASWATHQATLTLRLSKPWQTWTTQDGKKIDQVAFANFLEDNLADIVQPDSAQVLEAAKHLEAKKTVSFKSGINLTTGAVQFQYDENIDGKGKGTVTVPTSFVLGIAPFHLGSPYRVNARLRYAISDDRLSFTFKLDRPELIIEQAMADVVKLVGEATGIEPLIGTVQSLNK